MRRYHRAPHGCGPTFPFLDRELQQVRQAIAIDVGRLCNSGKGWNARHGALLVRRNKMTSATPPNSQTTASRVSAWPFTSVAQSHVGF